MVTKGAVCETDRASMDPTPSGARSLEGIDRATGGMRLHPAWQRLIQHCREVGHGEIERIKIQDGLPVSVEVVTRRIRLC